MTVLKTSMRNFLAHKGRMALSAIAVLLSVAFVSGTLVFTDTANATFDRIFQATAADVTVSPKDGDDEKLRRAGTPPTLPASQVAKLAGIDGVKTANGDVNVEAVTVVDRNNDNIGPSSGAPTIATNWDENELKAVEITSGHAPRGPTEMMVDADTADAKELEIGDELRVITVHGEFRSKISGIATFQVTNPGSTLVYFDDATAQRELLATKDRFTAIALAADSGVSHEELKAKVVAAVGSDYEVRTQDEAAKNNQEELSSELDILKYVMLGFAGVAVLVGIFLIVNTFSMLVAQRTREIGLMRAIGSSRKQINRSVLVEALLLGVVGSVLGIFGGIGLAVGLMKLMEGAGLRLDTSELTIKTSTPVIGLTIGIVVTVIAAYIPARRAGRISPMAALRDAGTPASARSGRVRAAIGLLLTAAGAAGLVMAANADKAADGSMALGAGILLTLVGFIVIGPVLAGFVVRVISALVLRIFGPVGRMAERNALRNPRRTGATGAALMIGLALVACLSVVGSSLVASADEQLESSVGADYIIEAGSSTITPQIERKIKSVEGLEHVTVNRDLGDARLTTPDGRTASRGLTAADPTYAEDLRSETVAGELSDAYAENSMSVNEGFAEDYGVKVGDRLTVKFAEGGTAKLTVRAVTSDDTVFDKGAMYLSIATARQYVPADKMPPIEVMFAAAVDGQEEAAYTALKTALDPFPQIEVRNQADYKELLEDQMGQMLNMVYGLLGLAIIVAVLGVVNTLALSVVERTREIGLMRAIGLSRRQMRRMIRLESVVIALFGALLGLGLGMGWGTTAQRLLALEGLKVLEIPWPTIIGVFIGSAVVGLIAALVPAFRAGRMNVLKAIATD
ncbi:ABC transporter permease [Streptomyces sp. NPDC018031]|uniref:ABC transporter permease n=1 Tax=Streptomyces sp. NPDC018031 TaxID=3365033 RepID=UPI0037A10A48